QGDDHVVDPAQTSRALRDQARGERAVAIAWHVQINIADLGSDRLRCRAVARVREPTSLRIALVIADVVGQLRPQSTFEGGLDQPGHEPALTGQLQLTSVDLGEQRIQRTRLTKLIESLTTRLLRTFVYIHGHRHSDIVPSRRDRTAYTDHLTRPTAAHDPGEGTLDHPAPGQNLERLDTQGFAHNLDADPQPVPGPVHE